jgi:hypothetical protein
MRVSRPVFGPFSRRTPHLTPASIRTTRHPPFSHEHHMLLRASSTRVPRAPSHVCCSPRQNESFMGDVVTLKVRQNQAFKFVFKRKIFLKAADDPSDDVMFERLVYLQARAGCCD